MRTGLVQGVIAKGTPQRVIAQRNRICALREIRCRRLDI